MKRLNDQKMAAALKPHLNQGEQLRNCAHGIELPGFMRAKLITIGLVLIWAIITFPLVNSLMISLISKGGPLVVFGGMVCGLNMMIPIIPILIWMATVRRDYLFGLTDNRLVVLRYKGALNVKEVIGYDLQQLPEITTKTGAMFTKITIQNPGKPSTVTFQPKSVPKNRERAKAIANTLNAAPTGS